MQRQQQESSTRRLAGRDRASTRRCIFVYSYVRLCGSRGNRGESNGCRGAEGRAFNASCPCRSRRIFEAHRCCTSEDHPGGLWWIDSITPTSPSRGGGKLGLFVWLINIVGVLEARGLWLVHPYPWFDPFPQALFFGLGSPRNYRVPIGVSLTRHMFAAPLRPAGTVSCPRDLMRSVVTPPPPSASSWQTYVGGVAGRSSRCVSRRQHPVV